MNFRPLIAILIALLTTPVMAASPSQMRDAALEAAIASFSQAKRQLAGSAFLLDIAAYEQALTRQRFQSDHWGADITVKFVTRDKASGSCDRFAAFVRLPPEEGVISLVFCPQFFNSGTDNLRRLTILHELVHVVAGPDECRAMAFAASVEQAAHGHFTPVDSYWKASNCAGSDYRLP
ncbi:hypothetical protein [Devosia sp. A449]